MTYPQTPDELHVAFLGVLQSEELTDPVIIRAVKELITKIEAVYCGLAELTSIEFLFGRSLLVAFENQLNKDQS
jgi:hypothetical protein